MKKRTFYKVVCEYDIGLESCIYPSEGVAWAAAREAFQQTCGDGDSFEEMEADGLIYVEALRLLFDL